MRRMFGCRRSAHGRLLSASTLALLLLLIAPAVSAQVPPQPEQALRYQNLSGIRANPLGLVDVFYVSYRLRLYESDQDVLTQNYVGIGLAGGLSPAWGRIGGIVEVQPLTVLRLWARYVFVGYFGTFNLLASFPDASSDFSDSAIEDRADQPDTENLATTGTELTLGADFQLKVGPMAVRNFTRAYYADMSLRSGDTTFFDQIYDLLMPDEGWVVTNELDGLYVTDFGLIVGARWTYSKPFYQSRHRGIGGEDGPSNDIHRVGPLIAYQFSQNLGGKFEQPTLLLLAQWHAVHRWRTGEDVSTAVPYVGLGFQFRGDLLSGPETARGRAD